MGPLPSGKERPTAQLAGATPKPIVRIVVRHFAKDPRGLALTHGDGRACTRLARSTSLVTGAHAMRPQKPAKCSTIRAAREIAFHSRIFISHVPRASPN